MLKEYAVDPEIFISWKDFRFYISLFGHDKGRMISRFPGKWKKMVYNYCKKCQGFRDVELSKVYSILSEDFYGFDRKFIRNSRNYDSNLTWFENALISHNEKAFHSIISNHDEECVDRADTIDEFSECLKISSSPVSRKPDEIVKRFQPYFHFSNEILFIDAHFNPCEKRYYLAFRVYLNRLFKSSKRFKRIEIHAKMPIGINSIDDYVSKIITNLGSHIPVGREITFYIWDSFHQEENLHPRYLLTEIGGLSVDYGLDQGTGNQTTDIRRLDNDTYIERFYGFQQETAKYHLNCKILIKNTTGGFEIEKNECE